MQTIPFRLLHPDAQLPQRAHPTDACYDVVAVSRTIKKGYIEYGLGFATAIPPGWEGVVRPRSSISNYCLALCNAPATIDADYRGEWKVRFRFVPPVGQALTPSGVFDPSRLHDYAFMPNLYEVGDRVAQVQFQRVPEVRLVAVDDLDATARGADGFGSTGR